MLPPSQTQKCAMVQLYCSEQIAIPETFPNILKTYAKAAIRTQPYDLLRWSAEYFRCLANNAPPPAKIRLERSCRHGSLTKGYLKVLVAQVGKGFFISRCLLQERWKALCLDEDDLLKYLSLCRMLNWPQVHWLKVLAVMIGSLNETPNETMAMLCELLTEDMEGGLARMPYWMFKICYTFVAKLNCAQEQCFVNGQLVLPWGDLEEVPAMERLPRVLSAALLRDTIIKSCKAKFNRANYKGVSGPSETSSDTSSLDFMMSSSLGNPKELFDKCEDFETITLLLQEAQVKPLTEDDFKGPHYISEKQLEEANKREVKIKALHQEQAETMAKNAQELIQKEALQMLDEVGPPWTWLHQFTGSGQNNVSYNFIDQESIQSDMTFDGSTSAETFDLIKEEPKESDSSCNETPAEKCSIEGLKILIEEAGDQQKCEPEKTSSIISFLKSDDPTVLKLTGEPYQPRLDLAEVIGILDRAEANGVKFSDLKQLIDHIRSSLMENTTDFPPTNPTSEDERPAAPITYQIDYVPIQPSDEGSISIPSEWKETIAKQVNIPAEPSPNVEESKLDEGQPKAAAVQKKEDEITKVFDNTVGIPPEQVAKMPKFCFETKDEDELVLGLVPIEKPLEKVEIEEEDLGSMLSDSTNGVHVSGSEGGYRQDDEDILKDSETGASSSRGKALAGDRNYFCCMTTPSLKPPNFEPPQQYHCTIKPMPGIGAAVSQKTIDDFLAFMRVRSRSQRGLINPRNFKEERCPYMVDTN